MTIGARVIVLLFERGAWRAASFAEIEILEADLMGGKKTGATAVIKVHADTTEDEHAILAALREAFE